MPRARAMAADRRSGARPPSDHSEPPKCDRMHPRQLDPERRMHRVDQDQAPGEALKRDPGGERDRRDPEASAHRTPGAGRDGARTRCHATYAKSATAATWASAETNSAPRASAPVSRNGSERMRTTSPPLSNA